MKQALAAIFSATVLLLLAQAAEAQKGQALKAIDPNQLEYDTPPPAPDSGRNQQGGSQQGINQQGGSQNPFGSGIQGQPLGSRRGPGNSEPAYQAQPAPGIPTQAGSGWNPGQSQNLSQYESRISRLEQVTFGSAYPEHEVEDRLDHIEIEVFSKKDAGMPVDQRLARLESKIVGQTAFAQQSQAAPSFPLQSRPPGFGQAQPYSSYVGQPTRPYMQQQGPANQAFRPAFGNGPGPGNQGMPPPYSGSGMAPGYPNQMSQPYYGSQAGMGQPNANLSNYYQYSPQNQVAQNPPLQNPPPQISQAPPQQIPPQQIPLQQMLPRTAQSNPANPINATNPSGLTKQDRQELDPENFISKIPVKAAAGDYFAAISKFGNGTVARWTKFPVLIHLPQGSPANWNKSLENAVAAWGRYLPLKIAAPTEMADIELAWINNLPPKSLGQTNLEVFNGRMRLTVYLLRPSYYLASLTSAQDKVLRRVAEHEIGHAIGIFGHSGEASDAMYSMDNLQAKDLIKYAGISARDLNTLKRIYDSPSLPAGYQSPHPMGWSFRPGN